jgi:hypothetical protein
MVPSSERISGRVMDAGRRNRSWRWIALSAGFLALAGCPGGPDQIDPSAAYPTLGQSRPTRDRRTTLVVFTATFTDLNLVDDSGTMHRHTGYTIYTEHGQKVDYVRNYVGMYDTEPTAVELDPGRYLILLDNPEKQPPVFKVILEDGKMTTVSLPR